MDLLANPIAQIVAAVLGSLVTLSVLDDAAAELAARTPVIGPIAARFARWASGHFRQWLGERIPAIADRIVRQIEGTHAGAAGSTKLEAATAAILASPAAAGLRPDEARAAAQAAVDRAKAAPQLAEDSSRISELEDELETALQQALGVLQADLQRAATKEAETKEADLRLAMGAGGLPLVGVAPSRDTLPAEIPTPPGADRLTER